MNEVIYNYTTDQSAVNVSAVQLFFIVKVEWQIQIVSIHCFHYDTRALV